MRSPRQPRWRLPFGVLRKLISWALSTFAVCLAVFIILDLLPGDVTGTILGMQATPETTAQLRQEFGLDRPVLARFWDWVAGLPHGDFGIVFSSRNEVSDVLDSALERSIPLALCALTVVIVIGGGAGTIAGLYHGSFIDRIISSTALGLICMPEFVIGTFLLAILAKELQLLPPVSLVPVGGDVFDDPIILILPTLTLASLGAAYLARILRAIVAQESALPHVEAARLAGLSPIRVFFYHLLPGIVAPAFQPIALMVPYTLAGGVIAERLFGFPGLGTVLVTAVSGREINLLMGCVLLISSTSLAAFFLADLVRERQTLT